MAVDGREFSSACDSYRSLRALTDRFSRTVGCAVPLRGVRSPSLLALKSLGRGRPKASVSGLAAPR